MHCSCAMFAIKRSGKLSVSPVTQTLSSLRILAKLAVSLPDFCRADRSEIPFSAVESVPGFPFAALLRFAAAALVRLFGAPECNGIQTATVPAGSAESQSRERRHQLPQPLFVSSALLNVTGFKVLPFLRAHVKGSATRGGISFTRHSLPAHIFSLTH